MIIAAKAEIEQESHRAREALRGEVAALVVAGAGKVLRREVKRPGPRRLARSDQERAVSTTKTAQDDTEMERRNPSPPIRRSRGQNWPPRAKPGINGPSGWHC